MSLNDTPSGERIHIGFFGTRNAGKSSLVNRVTGQRLAVVSAEKGTTTDPVYKAMELLPLGPVMIIDTPGFDDSGELGALRVEKTSEVLGKTDIAVLVIDSAVGTSEYDRRLMTMFSQRGIPYIVAMNKADKAEAGGQLRADSQTEANRPAETGIKAKAADAAEFGGLSKAGRPSEADSKAVATISVSALTGVGVEELIKQLAALGPAASYEKHLVADLLSPGDHMILVVPIDESAPKGRIILPQQQVIRDGLEAGALITVCRETELAEALKALVDKPAMVITDSQAFKAVAAIVPEDVPLTSFSILMARYKGFLDAALKGVAAVESLKNGDSVLIAEGCTHHRQCNDIGTVKIPRWLKAHCGAELNIETCSGREFPQDLSRYKLVIHCGGCMLNEREVQRRMHASLGQGVPFINYGVFIAYVNGILARSVAALPDSFTNLG